MATAFTIGHLAKATGTKVETVRYYERIGLLAAPGRTEGNYRAYGTEALSQLSFIRRARDLGFSIDQVRDLLDLAGQAQRDCGSVDAMATGHLAEIDRKLADLTALRRELSTLISSCRGGTISDCRILEALAPRAG
ncbi:MAG: helix-turn-helix domain-containing protein [Sphingomonas sp.]|jgi:Cu(I)-responsive transcriptional regulator|uniref:MerR family transcriptional regulator n=1 Tax=Sphingomonas sp. TaxID=28214 RepID=UPI00356538D8